MSNNQTLKETITSRLDILDFLDILNYSFEDIIDKFDEEIGEYQDDLEEACRY